MFVPLTFVADQRSYYTIKIITTISLCKYTYIEIEVLKSRVNTSLVIIHGNILRL